MTLPSFVIRHSFVIRFSSFVILPLLASACTQTESAKLLQVGYSDYSANRLEAAEVAATKYIAAEPNSPNLDEAYYLRGLARFSRGEKPAAAQDMLLAAEKTTHPDLKAKAYRVLGDIAYAGSRWQDALDDYLKALTFPAADNDFKTHCNYYAGACLQALGQWPRATPYFQRVVTDGAGGGGGAGSDAYLKQRAVARMDAKSFTLQFGAFTEGTNAAQLVSQLQAAGITAKADSEMRENNKVWFVVRSGSYSTYTAAQTARSQLPPKFVIVDIVP